VGRYTVKPKTKKIKLLVFTLLEFDLMR
jgi:hypothetical protein